MLERIDTSSRAETPPSTNLSPIAVAQSSDSRHFHGWYLLKDFSRRYPCFSMGRLRHMIFYASERHGQEGMIPGNGLAPALRKVGGRIYISEQKFLEWFDAQDTFGGDQHG